MILSNYQYYLSSANVVAKVMSVKKFVSSLDKLGYDHNLLNDFLLSMDLSKPVEEILTIDNFLWYCNIFDRCEHKSDIILTLK